MFMGPTWGPSRPIGPRWAPRWSHELCYLGIDNNLNWKIHINYIAGKLSRGIGILYKARKNFNNECLLTLYYSFIYRILIYCNHIWGNIYISKFIQTVCTANPSPRSHLDPIYKQLGLLKFPEIKTYLIGMFMFEIHHNDAPCILQEFFIKNKKKIIKFMNITLGMQTICMSPNVLLLPTFGICYQGVIVWNKIFKAEIYLENSEVSFEKMWKMFLLQNILNGVQNYWLFTSGKLHEYHYLYYYMCVHVHVCTHAHMYRYTDITTV